MTNARALAALLAYPEAELVEGLPFLKEIFSGDKGLVQLLEEMQKEELHVLQERYVDLFDRSRALSLHLFEHVHGESRDRGQAMVDLAETYASRGFEVAGGELPDYLPAFLEFVSVLDPREGRNLLKETAEILRALGDRLAERGSRYSAVFAALLAAAGEAGLTKKLAPRRMPGEESSPAAIDKVWMEEPVTFMDGPQPVKFYEKGARP
ncbi:MAG TPA: nitrate reductase molybdenum cofactor assembly chaperone [Burkholderiales bacterium]|jgi:nitrate reductase delta subunit|nr:nitrate reductase molybdenum cofactor assembly chaperone [Burkholderiales bacterium]